MVKTGVTAGLSEEISFSSIEAENFQGNVNSNEVVTSVAVAVRFIMELDERECKTETRDPSVVDYGGLGLLEVGHRISRMQGMPIEALFEGPK